MGIKSMSIILNWDNLTLLSILWYWHDQILSLHQGVRIWNFKEKAKQKKKTRNKKNLSAVFFFLLNEECPELLNDLGSDHQRGKPIPLWNSSGEKMSS